MSPLLALAVSIPASASLPARPSYAYKVGETYSYRYEDREPTYLRTATIRIEVIRVSRNGNADLSVSTEITSPGRERPPSDPIPIPVDHWLYYAGKDETGRAPWELLARIERPGLRKGGTYTLTPGENGTALYEIRDESPTNALGLRRRKTILLDGGRLPISAEIRSEFPTGGLYVQTLTRLPDVKG